MGERLGFDPTAGSFVFDSKDRAALAAQQMRAARERLRLNPGNKTLEQDIATAAKTFLELNGRNVNSDSTETLSTLH